MPEITKELLEDLYTYQKLSKSQIIEKHKIQNISRLLKRYGIKTRTDEEGVRARNEYNENLNREILPKELLIEELKTKSISKIIKEYYIPRTLITKWIREYELKTSFDKNEIFRKNKVLDLEENVSLTPKQLAIKYNTEIAVIKYYKKDFVEYQYTNAEIKEKIKEYNYDLNNKGLVKQLFYDDIGLYNSIIRNTENHYFTEKSIVERLYRILNDYEYDKIDYCSNCKTNKLIFTTLNKGYGGSDYKICRDCCNVLNGVSKLSQKMFKTLYYKLNNKDDCHFHDLNNEISIKVDIDSDNPHLNKRYYRVDFIQRNKIIEMDGVFYHQDENREIAKDEFLISKGYEILHITDIEYTKHPKETIEKCLMFLEG